MDIKAFARELADLQFPTGYAFENGMPFIETLGADRAEGLLNALLHRGYVLSHVEVESPSICEAGHEQHEPVH